MVNRILQLLCSLSLLVSLASSADSVELSLAELQKTPGQQITLDLTIRYDDGVDVVFQPESVEWGDLQLLGHSRSIPEWDGTQWRQSVSVYVTALIPGSFSIPGVTVHFYQGDRHWQATSDSVPLTVNTAFTDGATIQLQSIQTIPEARPEVPRKGYFLAMLVPVLLVVGLFYRRRMLKGAGKALDNDPSLVSQAKKASENGQVDWELLRQWLMVRTGCDPHGKLTTSEPLLHRYQTLRFRDSTNKNGYLELCRSCEEKWG